MQGKKRQDNNKTRQSQDKTRQGKARQGKARQGKARQMQRQRQDKNENKVKDKYQGMARQDKDTHANFVFVPKLPLLYFWCFGVRVLN